MDSYVPYNALRAYKVNHKLILGLAESLTDEQMLWKPAGYNNSIGFNLWHIARWSDNLIAEILKEFPDLDIDIGARSEIWEQESLAERWGLPPVLYPGGTGLSDEAADGLIFPTKDEMLAYLRKTFARTEEFIEKFDARYSDPIPDETLHKTITDIRWNLYYYAPLPSFGNDGSPERTTDRQRLCRGVMDRSWLHLNFTSTGANEHVFLGCASCVIPEGKVRSRMPYNSVATLSGESSRALRGWFVNGPNVAHLSFSFLSNLCSLISGR